MLNTPTTSDSDPTDRRPLRLRLVHAGPTRQGPPSLIGVPPTQGTLALAYDLPSGVPATPEAPDLRVVAAVDDDDENAELKAWAGMLGVAFVEVLAGLRPASQLVRWTSQRVARQLTRLPAPAASGRPVACNRPRVTSVHLGRPAPDVAEAAVVWHQSGRVRATALRLERVKDRWVCTAVSVG
jgi:Family of unknown function (DUF6459)